MMPWSLRGLILTALATAFTTMTAALLVVPTPSQALIVHPFLGSFGPEGSGPLTGFSNVQSVAVDQSTGDVYVYEEGNAGSVYKFNSVGEPQSFSKLGKNVIEGAGARSVDELEIAVDGSTGSAKGDIYIANGHDLVIYSETGESLGELSGEGVPWCGRRALWCSGRSRWRSVCESG